MLRKAYAPKDPQTKRNKIRSGCLTLGSREGGNATSPLHSRGSPTKGNKIRSGCLTLAFSEAQKTAEMLRQCCILGGPHRQAR